MVQEAGGHHQLGNPRRGSRLQQAVICLAEVGAQYAGRKAQAFQYHLGAQDAAHLGFSGQLLRVALAFQQVVADNMSVGCQIAQLLGCLQGAHGRHEEGSLEAPAL